MPQISVIVPVYKVESYLRRCVDSVLSQEYNDFELILVDDGSPDDSSHICDEYIIKDNRIIVIHQKNGGLSAARNAGIDWAFANSDSEWISFIDSDDWVNKQYLSALYSAVKTSKLNLSLTDYIETDGEIPLDYYESACSMEIWDTAQYQLQHSVNAIIACGKLYRKDDFRDIRYPAGKLHEDEFVTYRILFKHDRVAVVDSKLYYYYINRNGITKGKWNPARLVAIDAFHEKALFYKDQNIRDLYEQAINQLFSLLLRNLHNENIIQNKAIKKQLRKRYVEEYRIFNKDIAEESKKETSIYYWRSKYALIDYALNVLTSDTINSQVQKSHERKS